MSEERDHAISNGTYDLLKKVVTLGLPGLATLYTALSAAWGSDVFPNPEAVVSTLAALAVFGGVVISMTTKSWNNSEAKFDGALTTTGVDPDTGHPSLQLSITTDPNLLAGKDFIRLKTGNATPVV